MTDYSESRLECEFFDNGKLSRFVFSSGDNFEIKYRRNKDKINFIMAVLCSNQAGRQVILHQDTELKPEFALATLKTITENFVIGSVTISRKDNPKVVEGQTYEGHSLSRGIEKLNTLIANAITLETHIGQLDDLVKEQAVRIILSATGHYTGPMPITGTSKDKDHGKC